MEETARETLLNDASSPMSGENQGLCGSNFRILFRGKLVSISFANEILLILANKSNNLLLRLNLNDVIGAKKHIKSEGCVQLEIYSYPVQSNCLNVCSRDKVRTRRIIQLLFLSDRTVDSEAECIKWSRIINPVSTSPRHYLVFLNPVSGQGASSRLWEGRLRSMYIEAGATFTAIVTVSPSPCLRYFL
jgi:hypothetical protein